MSASTASCVPGVPIHGTVIGTLLNFRGALERLGPLMHEPPYKAPPRAPVLYIKPRNTWVASGQDVEVPDDVKEVEIGVTLGVLIGRSAARVRASCAFDYVAGYVVVNDLTVPHRNFFRPAIKARCRDGFCPIGPAVIPRDVAGDPDSLMLRAYVNGELRQENNTRNLVRPVAQLIADVSEFMTLAAGDVLLVGVPEAAPNAMAGDRVTVEVERVGMVENRLVPERTPR